MRAVMKRTLWLLALCWLIAQPCLLAQTGSTEAVLIRNVLLIEGDDRAEDVLVNILIRDGKLDGVTRGGRPASFGR